MSSSFGLHQTQGLSQALSPQMQQSLALLQAPALELRALVHAELVANPTLEEANDEPAETVDPAEPPAEEDDRRNEARDEEWREYFAQSSTHPTSSYTAEDAERRQFFFDSQANPVQLSDHLSQQLGLATNETELIAAGDEIIGNLDEDGFLQATLEEIASAAAVTHDTARRALDLVQTFDPVGVAARDLRECLLIQLRRLGKANEIESEIVAHHLNDLGRKRYAEIARALRVTPERVQQAAQFIATLQPRPGSAFATENRLAIVQAELAVVREGDEWVVIVNDEGIPKLRLSDTYKDLLGSAGDQRAVRDFLRDKMRAGKFLIRCLALRQQTLFNIMSEIVRRQREFFDYGPQALKPLTMSQVADAVGVHETTVSRAAANKYVRTPHGLFDLKYFFTPGYQTASGEMLSNTTVKEAIASLVAQESPRNPLSDEEMMKILSERGIPVARRTVAKYRAELNILPSNLRRSSS